MKRFLSTVLSVIIAAGSCAPNIYAAEDAPVLQSQQSQGGYEDDGVLPEVIHISGDKLQEMIEDYNEDDPEETAAYKDGESSDTAEAVSYADSRLHTAGPYALNDTVEEPSAEDEEADIFAFAEASEAPIRAYADTNTYTEYVYIRSVQDLLAIDGHDGGYYELASDIDLKGMEWPGISLTNAVFDGKGHYIYNLTQTSEQSWGLFKNTEDKNANVYVTNVNLSDININVTNCTGDAVTIGVLGSVGITPENCYASGNITTNVTVKNLAVYVFAQGINCDSRVNINVGGSSTSPNGNWYVYNMIQCRHSGYEGDIKLTGTHDNTRAYGLYRCTDKSVFYGDMDLNANVAANESAYIQINGMYSCEDCAFKGDITAKAVFKERGGVVGTRGMSSCTDSDFKGDVTTYSSGAEGIPSADAGGGTNCTFIGDISCYTNGQWNGYVSGIGGDSSTMTGNLYANVNGPQTLVFDVYGVSGKNCVLNGNIIAKGNNVVVLPIHYAENSIFNGNVTSSYRMHGIYAGSKNCTINGNLSAVGSKYYDTAGITNGSTGCTINGFISVQNGDITGIYGGSGNTINGDVMTQNGQGCGIKKSSGSYISGSISEKQGYEPLYVTAESPYMGYFECAGCHQKVVSARDLTGEVHCTRTSSSGSVSEYKYGKLYEMNYSKDTGDATDTGEPIEFPPDQEKFSYTVKLVSTESGEVIPGAKISIDGKEYTTNENGIISVSEGERNVMLVVKIDGNVMLVNRNFYPIKDRENVVEVCEIAVDVDLGADDDDPGNQPTASFNGKKFSMFDLPASVSLPKVGGMQMTYDKNRRAYRILFGDIKKVKDTGKDFNRMFIGIQNLVTNAKNGLFSDKDFMKLVNTPQQGALGFKGSGNIVGYIELLKKDDDTVATGAIMARYTARAENTIPFPAAPVFFVTYGVTGTLEAGLTLTMSSKNLVQKSFEPHAVVALTVMPNVGLGVGMKKFASAEAGLDAILRGQITYPFRSAKEDLSAWLTGEFYILGSIMGFEGRAAWTIGRWKLFPSDQAVKAMESELKAFDVKDMMPADRSYLQNKTQDTREGTVKSNIYPYSTVQMGMVNQKRMLVWLDDDPTRDDLNRTALYFSIQNDDGTWSEPKQVYDDGTPDYQFSMFNDGGRCYLVWQNAVEKVTGSTPDEIAPKIDLYLTDIGQYAGQTEWVEPTRITADNSIYEYDPSIISDSSTGRYIIWKQNDKNTAMLGYVDAKESVYKYHIGYSGTEGPDLVFENMPLISAMEVNPLGGVACVTDTDGDITTPGSTLYYKGRGLDSEKNAVEIDTSYASDSDITGFTHSSTTFFFMENNTLKCMDNNGNVTEIKQFEQNITNPVIVSSYGAAKDVIFEVNDGFNTSLYCSVYKTSGWSAPLLLTRFDERVRSIDVLNNNKGGIEIAAVMADIDVKGAEDPEKLPENSIVECDVSETVRLLNNTYTIDEDISAVYIDTQDDIAAGCGATFEIGVQNDSLSAISKLKLVLTDDKGSELYSGDQYVSIESGGFGTLNQYVTLPKDFTRGSIKAEISNQNLTESNTENNIVSESFGGTDLELKIRANSIHRTGCVNVSVKNNGSVSAKNAVISIKDEEGKVIAEEKIAEILSSDAEKIQIAVPEAYSRPKEKTMLYAEVVSDSDDLDVYDNTDNVEVEAYTGETPDTDEFIFGDVDADKVITASDAAFVLQKTLVGTFEMPIQNKTKDWLKYADVDNDKNITASDAAFILQKTLVSTFELPAEKK